MYEVTSGDAGLCILLDGFPIVDGISPSLTYDDGREADLAMVSMQVDPCDGAHGTEHENVITYQDAAGQDVLTLTLTARGGGLVASATIRAPENGIGVRRRGLAAHGGLTLSIGELGSVDGLMANYLHKDWWTRPYFGRDIGTLPPRTQSVVWRAGDRYHHLLCVCDDVMKSELQGDGEGATVLTSAFVGGYTNVDAVLFALSSGDDPFALPARNVAAGMRALGTPYQTRDHKRYPEIFEYLGWCSWNALYRDVTAEGLLAKAQEVSDKELPVRWFIVDDGWLSHDELRLDSLQPDVDKFPTGFSSVVDDLKTKYGLRWVGVWHTLMGYWGGLLPESEPAVRYADALATTPSGRVLPAPDPASAHKFWHAWHEELRNAGIDFVKVDYQSGLITFWQQTVAVGIAARAAHEALEASVGANFDNAMINCMGMATENLWHRPMSSVTRNSDDFFPDQKESFIEHALQNAYNAYYHAPFMWLDWDMWWTQHEHAGTHAVLRAVSGGPVYVSDRVGETVAERLWPLVLSDGRLLRCDEPGMVTEDCLLLDPSQRQVPLKVWNRVGDAGIVAAVNVTAAAQTVRGAVGPSDVPGLVGQDFVIYEHFTRQCQRVRRDGTVPVVLESTGCALFVIAPVGHGLTPIGLVDKYIAPATIADWFEMPERTVVVLLEGGIFAWAADQPPIEVRVNGGLVPWRVGDGIYDIDCGDQRGTVWVEIVHG